MQADMLELDVQLTSDGEVVVFHDETISRCTNGRGRIADHTLSQLKKLDAGSRFSKEFAGEKIPTLTDVLTVCKDNIAVNIEIKTEAVTDGVTGGIEEKCLRIIDQTGMQNHVVFSSFDPRALRHLKDINPLVSTSVLFEPGCYGSHLPSQIVESLGADAFNCALKELTPGRLADLKSNSIPFNVYTVNDEKNMVRLLAWEASGIFTNNPDILRSVLEDFRWHQRPRSL